MQFVCPSGGGGGGGWGGAILASRGRQNSTFRHSMKYCAHLSHRDHDDSYHIFSRANQNNDQTTLIEKSKNNSKDSITKTDILATRKYGGIS